MQYLASRRWDAEVTKKPRWAVHYAASPDSFQNIPEYGSVRGPRLCMVSKTDPCW